MDVVEMSCVGGVKGGPSDNVATGVRTAEETGGLFAYGARGAEYGSVEGVRGL